MQSSAINLVRLVAAVAVAACSASTGAPPGSTPPRDSAPDRAARADSLRSSFTPADVEFMTGMIHHHAQALVMARMAPSHGASDPLQIMAERIVVGQNDEIDWMQRWLRDRDQLVPEPASADLGMTTHAEHAMHAMPGMLSEEQLAELAAARDREFDRLFLTYMIQHHKGAVTMVEELFSSYGAAQGDAIFKIASDIAADQASEIDRMQSMLHALLFDPGSSR